MSDTSPKRHALESGGVSSTKRARRDGSPTIVGSTTGPDMIKYIGQVYLDAEALNQKMKKLLLSVAGSSAEDLSSDHVKAWKQMTNAVNELVQHGTTICLVGTVPGYTTPPPPPRSTPTPPPVPPMNPASDSPPPLASNADTPATPSPRPPPSPTTDATTPNPKKRDIKVGHLVEFLQSAAKKRKVDAGAGSGSTKRSFSQYFSEHAEKTASVDAKKRFKKSHREGVERPLAGERKRGWGDDFGRYREGVGLKRPRPGYFQDGDPPMEYEGYSDDEDYRPGADPVCVPSDEDDEDDEEL